ncbi:MAG: hypothetical protein ACI96M_000386 [Candidatus Azotimanducaceae bacterium]|jgi:hypothetical protein
MKNQTKQQPTSHKQAKATNSGPSDVPAFDRDAFLKTLEGMSPPKGNPNQRYDLFGNPLPSTPWWQGFLFELWQKRVDISDPTAVLFFLCEHLRREFYRGPLPWERSQSRCKAVKQAGPAKCGELRAQEDLMAAEEELFEKLWYSRHRANHCRAMRSVSYAPKDWAQANAKADDIEHRYAKEELPPWDDYERGMVCGKLSALRWMLGDEWDMLDT